MRIAYLIKRAMELKVVGRRPVGRPKKILSKTCIRSGRRHEEVKHHGRYGN